MGSRISLSADRQSEIVDPIKFFLGEELVF